MEDLSPFSKLQPTCVKLARCGSVEDIDKLQEIVKELDKDSLNVYQEYIIFPLRLILMKKPSEKLLIRSIDFLTYFFERSRVKLWDVFTNIFSQLINILTNIPDPERVCDASEELKLSVCYCIMSLVKNTNEEILNEMYSQSYRLTLAQGFFIFVQLLKHEKSKVLRQTLLETIGTLAYNSEYFSRISSKTEELASESLANFFPGLSSALMNVITGDIKQGQSIFRLALSVFTRLIIIVMNDKYLEKHLMNRNTFCVHEESKLETTIKDSKWIKKTSSVLKTMMCNMKKLITHDQWKVRLEYLKFIDSVLSNCLVTLESCIIVLLPSIFALSVDSHPQIVLESSELIVKFSQKFQSLDSNSLLILIEEDIHLSTSFLIKSKFSSNDDQILNILRTLLGYIKLFDKSIDKLLLSSSNLERILLSLINISELDIHVGYLVEDMSLLEHRNSSTPLCDMWPKKKFIYFQSLEILNTISDICYYIGKFSNLRIITDYFFEKQSRSEQYELQCLFLTSNIFEGIIDRALNEDIFSFMEDTIVELFSASIWESSPLNVTSHKIHQICLVLEIIGKCSKVLKLSFKPLLIKILFPVLEQAGSSNALISRYGKICLYTIASNCCYSSVANLIQDNVDYVMNSIIINFHQFVTHPEMAVVLSVIMSEGSADILPYCKNSIYQIFGLLDCNQHQAYILLQILNSIVQSIRLSFPFEKKILFKPSTTDSNRDLKSAVTIYKKTLENSISDGEEKMQESDSTSKIDFEAAPPLHINITVEILRRCSHLQSLADLPVKILCLEMMENCILILGNYEVQLHPVIHELWPRFIFRFNEESSVSLAAFRVLLVMADECRDFVRRRVLQDIFEKLTHLLKKNFSNSLKQNFRNYQWHSACKLHLCVLSEIGNLFSKLDVSGKEITQLAEICLSYLNKLQSRTFQEAAYNSIKALITIDPDLMWLYYNILYCENRLLKAPHQNFYDFSFPNSSCLLTKFKIEI